MKRNPFTFSKRIHERLYLAGVKYPGTTLKMCLDVTGLWQLSQLQKLTKS